MRSVLRTLGLVAASSITTAAFVRAIGTLNPALSHDPAALGLALTSHKEEWRSAGARLSEIAAELQARHVEVKVVLQDGDAARVIQQSTRALQADLVVMRIHRRTAFESALLGSVADTVVQHAQEPILLVPDAAATEGWTATDGIDVLVTLDGSPFAEAALKPALGLATALRGSLVLLRATDKGEPLTAEAYLTRAAHDIAASDTTRITHHVASDSSPSAAILHAVDVRRVGLLVMATHGRSGFMRAVVN